MTGPSLLPPKKKNWTKGLAQVGVFIRTEDGHVIEMCDDRCPPERAMLLNRFLMSALDIKLACARCGKTPEAHSDEEYRVCRPKETP